MIRQRLAKVTAAAAGLTIASVAFGAGGATAATGTPSVDDLTPYEHATQLHQGLTEPTGSELAIRETDDAGIAPMATTPSQVGLHRISASTSGSGIRNTFATDIRISNAATHARVESGATISTFLGSGTGNVTVVDHFWANGISVSASVPAGLGFSASGNEADYVGTARGVGSTSNVYGGLEFSGLLFNVSQNVTSTWNVGPSTFSWTTT